MRAPIIVIAPDSFKGSLDAPEAARAIAAGLRRVWADAGLRECPLADGGEGTLDAILSAGGERRMQRVEGAGGATIDAAYGLLGQNTAVIEIAQIVGITDALAMATPVARRSTRGVGQLFAQLLDSGVRTFLVGVGGSSTNDGGAGLLEALGVRLLDDAGCTVAPTPEGLARVARVDTQAMNPHLASARITLMSDVNNPLCGDSGATAVFGPQKGVRANEIAALDAALARFASLAEQALGRHVQQRPGAGAAGGLGFAFQLLGAAFRSGAEVVADAVGLDVALMEADWLITGEGQSDAQTLLGKTPFVAAARARARGVPATLLAGAIDRAALPELSKHFAGCFSLTFGPITLDDAVRAAGDLLTDRAEQMGRLWDAARSRAETRRSRTLAAPAR
jgi:glycerate 2-kinase